MTFTDLNLPIANGLGAWTETASVANDNWADAENTLVTDALVYLATPKGKRVKGYFPFRDEMAKTLRLDLFR